MSQPDLLKRYERIGNLINEPSDLKVTAAILLLVEQRMKQAGETKAVAKEHIYDALSYYAGYYSDDVRRRFEKLLGTAHPVFGSVDKPNPVTPEEAYKMGMEFGKRDKQKLF